MLNIQAKRHIRCETVETPTAWLVVAVLLETQGTETIAVSEPRVIKVIPKTQLALSGTQVFSTFALHARNSLNVRHQNKILSPYVPTFGFAQSEIITWMAARPPTF